MPPIFTLHPTEITRLGPDTCRKLEDFLLKRLERDNVHCKAKTLRVMKFCAENGDIEFRRGMQKKTEAIRSCTSECARLCPRCRPSLRLR